MITFLSRFFIKSDMNELQKRNAYGILCGLVGIILNIILAASKAVVGIISSSIAITADAFNNLSDAGSSIVTMIGFKLAGQKPDEEHPYGHGRMEYIAGFVVAALILAMAVSLIKDSVSKIFHPEDIVFSYVTVAVLIFSILVKFYMAFYNRRVGKRINSSAVIATGVDSMTDCISTFVVLVSVLVAHFFGWQIDGYCGLLVGLFVGYAGINAAKDTINPLLGQPPEKEFVDKIEEITVNFDKNILGMHDLLVHDYGPGRRFITLHAEVPANEDVLMLHEIIDALEQELCAQLDCLATVHLDPIVVDDERINKLRENVKELINEYDKTFSIHDFRVVPGENRTNLIFDIVVPISYEKSDLQVRKEIDAFVKERLGNEYFTVIQVDKNMGVI